MNDKRESSATRATFFVSYAAAIPGIRSSARIVLAKPSIAKMNKNGLRQQP